MPNWDEVTELIDPSEVPDLEGHLSTYQREGPGRRSVEGFLEYLYTRKLLTEQRYRALHIRGTPDVSFETLLKRGDKDGIKRLFSPMGLLDEGSMGHVYVAKDTDLNRTVAFKQITRQLEQHEHLMRRFLAEVQITAQLDHPNIVPVYGVEMTPEGSMGYAMKLVQGHTLDDEIRETAELYQQKKPIDEDHSLATRLEHFLKVCDAIAFAHSRGVLHRDLKPANVMVGPFNEVYVMDWGLALVRQPTNPDETVDLTSAEGGQDEVQGDVIGSPAYMSPAQAYGARIDARADQYALGLVLQELVTLHPAIDGASSAEVLARARKASRNRVKHAYGRPIHPDLAAIIDKACSPNPRKRYKNVAALAEDVRSYLRREPVIARPDSTLRKLGRVVGRHRETFVILMLAVALVAATSIIGSITAVMLGAWQAELREERLAAVLTRVSDQGNRIDGQFMRYERLLEGLAASAAQALEDPADETVMPFLDRQYDNGKGPPDLARSGRYQQNVSVDHPVVKLAPGIKKAEVKDLLARTARLGPAMRRTMLRSRSNEALAWKPKKVRQTLAESGAPIVWTYVGLEQGLHIAFPGHGSYDPGFDARARPWYRLSAGKHGPNWGNPYVDAAGLGLILPCSTALYDAKGAFIGVAGIDLTFRYIIEELLVPGNLPIDEAFLVNDEGRIVVRSSETLEQFEQKRYENQARDLPVFPDKKVRAAVRRGESGLHEVGDDVVVYTHLNSLGWAYVVRGNAQELLVAPKN